MSVTVQYCSIPKPVIHRNYIPVNLTADTMKGHLSKVLRAMRNKDYDCLVIYGDREHGANYAYLTGFEPRFEESVIVLHADGDAFLLLGNENLKMAKFSFLYGTVIHVPQFSLPYQPMDPQYSFADIFHFAGIRNHMRIGCVGWKYFPYADGSNESQIDLPYFIVQGLVKLDPNGTIDNASGIFMDAGIGVRHFCNVNEIAHYEYGAGLASSLVYDAMNKISTETTEIEVAKELNSGGQPVTVTTICAGGDRFSDAVVFPRNKKFKIGDPYSITLGLRGGLTSRSGYVAYRREDLPGQCRDYLEKLVIPYYSAAVTWYETIGIGITGGEIYQMVEKLLPKNIYGWKLNPGHYTGQEEWTGSPIFPYSSIPIRNGTLLQMDIIPGFSGYAGCSMEDGVVIINDEFQQQLQTIYPNTWNRMNERKEYMKNVLGITLKPETFPLSDICGYYRPYVLNHENAMLI